MSGNMLKLAIVLALMACGACAEPTLEETQQEIHYVRDTRTDLCFAWTYSYGGLRSLVLVPCSPAVLALTPR